MKRVLHVIGIVCGGGVESVVMNYYRHIDRTKVQFDFVVDGYEKSLLDDEIESLGGRVYHVEPYKNNIFRYMNQIYHIVQDGHYDIVHSHMNTLAMFSLFPSWLAGAHVRILHNHSIAVSREGTRTILKYILRPFAPLFANRYAACSKLSGEWMYGKKAIYTDKVKIFNNAVNVEKFSFNSIIREKLRNSLGLNTGQIVIGHVGRFVFPKNHGFLLDVFANLAHDNDNVVLMLVGDGELRSEMEAKAKKVGIDKQVKFLGLRSDVAELYNAMDIFVLPSWYEGLPVVSVEAQANGLPCIISDRVSMECSLTSSIHFLRIEDGAKVWAKTISQTNIERNPKAIHELKIHQFDINDEAQKMVEWYGL